MVNHTNHTIQNQRWGGIEIRISHLEIKLDNNQEGLGIYWKPNNNSSIIKKLLNIWRTSIQRVKEQK